MRLIIAGFFLFCFMTTNHAFCQDQESIRIFETGEFSISTLQDTIIIQKNGSLVDGSLLAKQDTTTYAVAAFHPQLPLSNEPVFLIQKPFSSKNQDILFYSLLGLTLYLGIIKLAFPRYLQDLFLVIFQPKFKQSQTSDILQQSVAPAFFMNIFFVLTSGCFVSIFLTSKFEKFNDFWSLVLVSSLFIAGTYLTKYLFLNFTGWVLQVQNPIKKYLFIVLQLNKLFAIIVLPLIWLISFGKYSIHLLALEVGLVIIYIMIFLRFFLSFVVLKNYLPFQFFQVLIYIVALEIIPLFMIYKVSVQFFSISF